MASQTFAKLGVFRSMVVLIPFSYTRNFYRSSVKFDFCEEVNSEEDSNGGGSRSLNQAELLY